MVTTPGVGNFSTADCGLWTVDFADRTRRLLHIRRISAPLAEHDFVLARLGGHHELVRELAAHHARVRLDRDRLEPATLEDARVGVIHLVIARLRRLVRGVEAVGVLHDELLGAHQAEARADLIAELGLNLVEVLRHLPVGIDLARDERGDDFLVRRPEHPFLLGAVADLEQHVLGGLVAPALLPDIRRLEGGHEQFKRAGAIHLLAHDLLDLAQRAQPQRQECVEPARELADQPGAQKEFVRDDLGLSRRLFQRGNQCL